jgi:two-component system chemotaxis response regulator CheY
MSEADLFARFKLPQPDSMSLNIPILVAEPSSELGLIVVHFLEKAGFSNVRREKDGQIALQSLQKEPAAVIFAASELPSCSGLDLLKELREDPSYQRGAFILITQAMNKSEVMLAVESGVNELLVRPFTAGDIPPKIRSAYASYNNPRNPERLYEAAKQLLRAKHFDKAHEIYSALAEANATAARPHVGLARCYMAENKFDKALEEAVHAVQKNASFVHAYSLRADIYLSLERIEEGIADLKKAVDLSPLNVARIEHCCEVLLKRNMTKECVDILNKAIAAGLDHPYVTERLGYCYFLEKDYQNAQKYLKEAVRLEPENVSFLNSLAICYRDAKNFDESISIYNRIIKKDPENYQILYNKALVLSYKSAIPEAAKLLRRVLQIRPDFEKAAQKLIEIERNDEGQASSVASVPET